MSSGSIRIIQLPEKSSVNTDDYMAVDSSANGTKKVKFTDLLDDNLSAQNKAADAQATGEAINDVSTRTVEAINNVNTRIDNMINTQQNASVTTLWTGTLDTKNQSVTLSQSIANFDFIDVYVGDVDAQFIRRHVASTINIDIQIQNMSDDASVQFLRWWETGLTISGTTATINKCIKCYWDDFSQAPVVSQATDGAIIRRIDGVKIGHVENDEIVDARTGANDITYPTLGDAIRSQVTDLKSDITQIGELDATILYDSSHPKTDNKLINGYSGGEQNSSVMASTGYIKVDSSSIIYMTFPEVGSVSVSGWAFYDANKEFVSGDVYAEIGTGYYETSIVVPSNASYLRFGFPMSLWSNVKVTVTTKLHDHFKKMKEVKTFYSNGSFDNSGSGVSSSTTVRSDWINVDNYDMVLAIFPPNLKIFVNTVDDDGARSNKLHYNSLLERTRNKRVRFAFRYADDSSIQSDYESYLDDIKIYLVHTNSGDYDISVAPFDAEYDDKEKADIVLNGTNDTDIIQAIFGSRESIKALLYCGTYNVTKIHPTLHDKSCAFSTHESYLYKFRKIEIFGQKGSQLKSEAVKFVISSELHNSITNESAIFLVPRARDEENTIYAYDTLVRMENINILGYGHNKPIVYMDFLQAKSAEINRCYIRSDGNVDELPQFATMPNSKLTGIRVGHGSNNGVHNSVKHCYVMYCYIGVSCCGEHYILEDVLTHHCYVGFAFGDKITRNQMEHPNIMLGCSIEGCYRFMLLTKNGVMEEQPFVEDRPNNLWHSSLSVIGLSTESWWSGTADEASSAQATNGILEILKGCYTGNIEISSENNEVLETGSCINMGCTHYKDGTTYRKESENLVIV